MTIRVQRSGWENTLNIISYFCAGKMANLYLLDQQNKITLQRADYFLGIESYLDSREKLLALILGKEKEISLGYFIKGPSKLTIEEDKISEVKKILINLEDLSQAIIEFKAPEKVIYNHDI